MGQLQRRYGGQRLPRKVHAAATWVDVAGEEAQKAGFAGAVGADHHSQKTRPKIKIDPVDEEAAHAFGVVVGRERPDHQVHGGAR